MYQINANEGLREQRVRLSPLRQSSVAAPTYNTGTNISTPDIIIHVHMQVLALEAKGRPSSDATVFTSFRNATAGGQMLVVVAKGSPQTLAQERISPADIVETVRHVFMLNVSQAAAVFHVSRPTIYGWAQTHDMEQVRSRLDRDRMKALYRLAKAWDERGRIWGRWQEEVLPTGRSVLDLLSADTLDRRALLSAHDVLLARQGSLRRAENQRAQGAVDALRGAFGRLDAAQAARKKGKDSA